MPGPYINPWANPFMDALVQQQYGKQGSGQFDFMESDNGYPGWGLFVSSLVAPRAGKAWLENQYSNLYQRYASTQGQRPDLTWFEFLKNLNLEALYNQASPYERGLRPTTYAPRMRML